VNCESPTVLVVGEYGKFFSEQEILSEPMIIEEDKKVLKDLYSRIKNLS
jgi:hypothetical protein